MLTNASGDPNAGDSYIRRAGRSLIYAYHGALRAIKLYPVENAAVQRALEELTTLSREIIADSVECMVHAERMDALLTFAGCDKSLPGMLMAAARLEQRSRW